MKFKEYSNWVLSEIKKTKTFTLLNILGIWISVVIVLIFLSLAGGIEKDTIRKITNEMDLFTLEVRSPDKPYLAASDIEALANNSKVKQVIPVYSDYLKLSSGSEAASPNEETIVSGGAFPVYTENYYVDRATKSDPRAASLKFSAGGQITETDSNSIIVSESTFDLLCGQNRYLSRENYSTFRFALTAERFVNGVKESRILFCRIKGIARSTPYEGGLVYISNHLAASIFNWTHSFANSGRSGGTKLYSRFDLVTANIDELSDLRDELKNSRFTLKSVLDRIESVKNVILIVDIIFFLIFGIAIVIACFNIVITLTSSVLNRRYEIGVLKALGATDNQIKSIFLLHAVYISAAAGILGLISAYGAIYIIRAALILSFTNLTGLQLFDFNPLAYLIVLVSAVLLSLLAAFYPASRAVKISPVEILREK